jgi:peptidyl-tRNA hydrolase, PTH1 family
MGLFQRNIFTDDTPMYEIVDTRDVSASSLTDRTLLIVGLGNPGKDYVGTRHNVGFTAVDNFAKSNDFDPWKTKKDLKCEITTKVMGSSRVILIKPMTFMNNSGEAVVAVQKFYKLTNKDTVVVYDELAQKFGKIRARTGGSSAGHNGIKSLIQHCGNDFFRLRIGVANGVSDKAKSEHFVLAKFTKKEQETLPKIYEITNEMLTDFIGLGALIPETRETQI